MPDGPSMQRWVDAVGATWTDLDRRGFVGLLGYEISETLSRFSTLAEACAQLAAADRRLQELATEPDSILRVAQQRNTTRSRAATARAYLLDKADHAWLQQAEPAQLALLWRTAQARNGDAEFPFAEVLADAVEDQLRTRCPGLMLSYDDLVNAGVSRATSMHLAAHRIAHTFSNEVRSSAGYHLDDARADLRSTAYGDGAGPHYDRILREQHVLDPPAQKAMRELVAARPPRCDGHTAMEIASTGRTESGATPAVRSTTQRHQADRREFPRRHTR
jgi:hypothetical protein